MPILRALGGLFFVALLLIAPMRAGAQVRSPGEITVMTQNQYLGADLAPLLGASSPQGLNGAVLQLLQQAATNRFPLRADRQAAQIMSRRPDLVGLQEVFHLGCRDLPPRAGACAEPSIASAFGDQLSATLQALQARGGDYEVAARVVNFDLRDVVGMVLPGDDLLRGLPFTVDGRLGLLTAYDQDVILKRRGIATQPVRFAGCRRSAQGCNYRAEAKIRIPLPLGSTSIGIKRGFVAVDATLQGRTYRFANTHLEIREIQPANPASAQLQAAQATELLTALAGSAVGSRHLIVVGDFNSSPKDAPPAPILPPIRQFTTSGYVDTWAAAFGAASGFTCCQDADLRNGTSRLYERIDLIFARQPVLTRAVRIDGRDPAIRTVPVGGQRLWPSDHAAVVAWLKF